MSGKKNASPKGEGTLLTALLLSAPGPLVTGIAAVTSRSATQLADFLRRTAELVATFASWWIFRKRGREPELTADERARLDQLAERIVAIAMICSGIALLIVGVFRLFSDATSGNVIIGLVIAALGLLTNTIFWQRYKRLAREQSDAVLAAQQQLYRAKACVDLCVTLALCAVAIAPAHPVTRYIDALGSIAVAIYLLYNGLRYQKRV